MAEKKPSKYSDRGTIRSAEELDAYGVWVKSEPQDLTASMAETVNFNADAVPYADFDMEIDDTEESGFDFADTEESNFDFADLEPTIPEASVESDANVDFVDEGVTATTGGRSSEEASTQLLMKIANELSAIRAELSTLKKEFAGVRVEGVPGAKAEAHHGGFFDGEEGEDEKITLTGDEMENILTSADFSAEEDMGGDPQRDADVAALKELSEQNESAAEASAEPTEEIAIDFDNLGINLDDETEAEAQVNDDFPPLEAGTDDDEEIMPLEALGEDEELEDLRREGAVPFTPAPDNSVYLETDPFALDNTSLADTSIEDTSLEGASLEDTSLEDISTEDISIGDTSEELSLADTSEDLSLGDTALEDTSLGDISTEDTALADTSEDLSLEDTALEDTSLEDISIEDTALADTSAELSLEDTSLEDISIGDTSEELSLEDTSADISLGDVSEDVSIGDVSEELSLEDTSADISLGDTSEELSLEDASLEDISIGDTSEELSLEDTSLEDISIEDASPAESGLSEEPAPEETVSEEAASEEIVPPDTTDEISTDLSFDDVSFDLNVDDFSAESSTAPEEETAPEPTLDAGAADIPADSLSLGDEISADEAFESPAPLEEETSAEQAFDADSLDLSNAVIDEPDLSAGLVEAPLEEPVLGDISFGDDISLDMDDFGNNIDIKGPTDESADGLVMDDVETSVDTEDSDLAGGLVGASAEDLTDGLADDLAIDDFGAGIDLADMPAALPDEKEEDSGLALADSPADEPADIPAVDLTDDSLTGVIPEGFEANAEEAPASLDDDLETFADDLSIDSGDLSLSEAPAAKAANVAADADIDIPPNFKSELKSVLSYMDHLLESLPEDKIEEFAKSEYFDSYKKIFKELGLV